MYLARDLTSLSLAQIAREFDRDHTTVLHAVRVVSAASIPAPRPRRTIHSDPSASRRTGRQPPPPEPDLSTTRSTLHISHPPTHRARSSDERQLLHNHPPHSIHLNQIGRCKILHEALHLSRHLLRRVFSSSAVPSPPAQRCRPSAASSSTRRLGRTHVARHRHGDRPDDDAHRRLSSRPKARCCCPGVCWVTSFAACPGRGHPRACGPSSATSS